LCINLAYDIHKYHFGVAFWWFGLLSRLRDPCTSLVGASAAFTVQLMLTAVAFAQTRPGWVPSRITKTKRAWTTRTMCVCYVREGYIHSVAKVLIDWLISLFHHPKVFETCTYKCIHDITYKSTNRAHRTNERIEQTNAIWKCIHEDLLNVCTRVTRQSTNHSKRCLTHEIRAQLATNWATGRPPHRIAPHRIATPHRYSLRYAIVRLNANTFATEHRYLHSHIYVHFFVYTYACINICTQYAHFLLTELFRKRATWLKHVCR
jgi:hypothetical protein